MRLNLKPVLFASACAVLLSASAALGGVVGPRVAIVAAAANTANAQTNVRFTDRRDMLMADGRFSQVDIISTTPFGDGHTPTLAELQQYDAILHWTNDSNADSVALGNVFADYVDSGGGVVVAVFANTSANANRYLQGRWLAGQYEIIPSQGGHIEGPPAGTPGSSGFVHMSTPLDPAHPIFAGVGDVRLNWTTSGTGLRFGAHRPNSTALHSWATKLALWEDGKTAVAVHNDILNRVDLGIHPVSDLVNAGYYDLDSDTDRVIANALFYSATVPEPSSMLVVCAGGLALLIRRRHA